MIAISPIARQCDLDFILAFRSDVLFRHMPLITATYPAIPLQSREEVTLFTRSRIVACELRRTVPLQIPYFLCIMLFYSVVSRNLHCTTVEHHFTATRKVDMRQALASMTMARNCSGNHYELYQ